MKHKRTKPAVTKEQQAASEGWVYISGSKTIRGWNAVWVEAAQGGLEPEERTSYCLYSHTPTGSVPQG